MLRKFVGSNESSAVKCLRSYLLCIMLGTGVIGAGHPPDAKAAALDGAGGRAAPPSGSKSVGGRIVLERFEVDQKGELIYEVSRGPCRNEVCPFQVRLLEGQKVLGSRRLYWGGSPGKPEREKIDRLMGAGDPLQREWDITAWSTGVEEQNVAAVARAIELAPNLKGLLVHQRAGFDHLKRRHFFFVVLEKKLRLVWTASEGTGLTWSAVDAVGRDDGAGQEIIHFHSYSHLAGDDWDVVGVARYMWDAKRNRLEKVREARGWSVFAVVVGT